MYFPRFERSIGVAAAMVAALMTGTAQAALQDRDLDGNGVTDAFYDTDLNVTWLRETNLHANGWAGASPTSWSGATQWAADFSFAGYTDWRLPTGDASCTTTYNCTGSELGHLWYVELGNSAGAMMTNPGGFNWQYSNSMSWYWTSTRGTTGPSGPNAQIFMVESGALGEQPAEFGRNFAMAVRDGDVPAVPEPGTYALMLAGLSMLAVARRRRHA